MLSSHHLCFPFALSSVTELQRPACEGTGSCSFPGKSGWQHFKLSHRVTLQFLITLWSLNIPLNSLGDTMIMFVRLEPSLYIQGTKILFTMES